MPSESPDKSVGEWLELFAQSPSSHSEVASIGIRCACCDSVLEPNASNKIVRSIVTLAEAALPSLVHYLRIEPNSQNYIKYESLQRTHNLSVQQLDPIRISYANIAAIVEARKTIVGSLNHKGLREYLKFFGLDEARTTLSNVLDCLRRVAQVEETLLDDVEECQDTIRNARNFSVNLGTFLARDYLTPFLDNADIKLQDFLEQMKSRLATDISLVLDKGQLSKRYPLHEVERTFHVSVPLLNSGPGRAKDVRVSCPVSDDTILIDTMVCHLGNVVPGVFEVTFSCMVSSPCQEIEFVVLIDWGEVGTSRRKQQEFVVHASAQSANVEWKALEYSAPYSTEVAEGDAFVGREDKVRNLAAKILRSPMEPFYVTGQKRVGKTSLAIAAAEFAKKNVSDHELYSQYILWGSVADATPVASLRRLGEEIHDFLAAQLPAGIDSPDGDYAGSLSDLLKLARLVAQTAPNKRFLIILDEIDEIHEELYLSGDLAATFFANLRALSRAKNVGIILVGGENMPYIMDRQGQKLNNFSRINLSYYDRGSEWNDFRLLVQNPTVGVLHWHEDAVSEVYNASSGNPYFAKLICAAVFEKALKDRDADITVLEVKTAIEAAISNLGANSFVHLWQDGIHRSSDEREPEILRRLRVLVALARCLRNYLEPTTDNITKSKATGSLSDLEIRPVLNDFSRRGILTEREERFELTLPIFQLWLVDVGAGQLAADGLSAEIADSILEQENSEMVKAAEIVTLVEGWPTYCGRKIGTDDVRAWIDQVSSKLEQRILFQILSRLRVFGEPEIREKLKSLHSLLRREIPVPVRTRRKQRRADILVTYVDGVAKSGASYASLYAEENEIMASQVVPPESIHEKYDEIISSGETVNAIVVVDDIAGTGGTLSQLLSEFVSEYRKMLENTKLRAFTVAATPEGEARINATLGKFDDLDIEFRAAEVLTRANRAFPDGWQDKARQDRAESLCRDLGSRIYKNQPLGFGGFGLLVVFPRTVPNNTLPIIHSPSKRNEQKWNPLFPRPVN